MKTTRLVAPALGAVLLANGCSAWTATETDAPDEGKALPARELAEGKPETGPKSPRQGKWYPYDMFAHCGIGFARFGGQTWKLERVHTTSHSRVAGDRPESADHVPGYMALLSPDEASFEAAGLPPMAFVPAEEDPPACA